MDIKRELQALAIDIERHATPDIYGESIGYYQALDYLGELVDRVSALAALIPDSTLSGKPNGYLPSRHPNAVAKLAERIGYAYPTKTLPNTIAGHDAGIHPVLRPTSQTEEFSE